MTIGDMFKAGAVVPIVLGLLAAVAEAQAPAADGARPLLCAMMTVLECDASGRCERRTLENRELPPFVLVDPAKHTVSATGADTRRTQITSAVQRDGRLIVQGGEEGRSWSATIASDTGKMAVAVVDHDATFSIFGACIPAP
jgi:hypothetical protein